MRFNAPGRTSEVRGEMGNALCRQLPRHNLGWMRVLMIIDRVHIDGCLIVMWDGRRWRMSGASCWGEGCGIEEVGKMRYGGLL